MTSYFFQCDGLVYRFKEIVGGTDFSVRLGGIAMRCRRVGCDMYRKNSKNWDT